jgi:hypothetical protein
VRQIVDVNRLRRRVVDIEVVHARHQDTLSVIGVEPDIRHDELQLFDAVLGTGRVGVDERVDLERCVVDVQAEISVQLAGGLRGRRGGIVAAGDRGHEPRQPARA